MLPVTNAFRENIYAAERQILARATIHMDAFGDQAPLSIDGLMSNMQGKVVGSTAENSNLYKTASNQYLLGPTNVAWAETGNTNYANIGSLNGTTDDKTNAATGQRGLQLFGFNVLDMLEREFGDSIWQGKVTVAEKRDLAISYLDNMTLNWHGYGLKPTPTFAGFRYIRDYVNGSTVNANAYWNEIKCMAGATNRAAAKVPTANTTLTNGANVTDGNATTYAYIAVAGSNYVQIDLGAVYSDIDSINIIHYYLDGRTFHGTKTQVSVDGVTWTTLRDSAVSGEYVETVNGLTLKPMTSVPYCGLAIFENNSAFGNWDGHSLSAITKITKSYTNANIPIADDGFMYVCAYSEISNTSGNNSRIKTDYVELILTGEIRITTRVYDNTKILRWNLLEEINVLNESLPSNEASITLDNADGEFNVLTYGNMYDVLASKPTIFIEAGLVTDVSAQTVEWIPCGKYFITEWKNDLANRVISFTGHDYFFMLGDTSYGPTPTNVANNLLALANDVLEVGGVPTTERILDDKLLAITTAGKITDRIDCRTALQHIAIAAQLCIFQDRFGNVVMKPFASIDKLSNFLLYTRNPAATPSQLSVIGNYAGPNTFSVVSTGSGMRFIDYDAMFDYPEIELTSNINQLIIKVYFSTTDPETLEVNWDSRETIHNNPHITGNTGVSFTIDNPLVLTDNMANEIADWYFDESLYNANFRANWRQNPAIECTDMVLIEDPFHSNKQTRVYRQEFNYEGYLEGTTESRGGI
jgi:hypothetical protein